MIWILIWLGVTVVCIFVPLVNGTPLRVVFALPTILFIPGYVLIAALFPGTDDIDLLERIALSFGLSIAIVPLIGLALNYTPWGIRLEPVVTALVLFTVLLTVTAVVRRVSLPQEQRFRFPVGPIVREARGALIPEGSSRLDRALSIVLILAIIAAVGATIYVIVVPKEGEKFTEFYILGEKGKAADYPRTLVVGNEYGVIIGVGNHEYRNVTYTVECHAMNMTFDPLTNTSTVHAMERLDRFTLTLPHNSTVERRWNFTAPGNGFNRIQFLLFNETVPSDEVEGEARIAASYRDLHLWVEIRSR
ncbi:MAG: DUF1616 domain-containing protein [Methanomicrobiales archaeon]|nr:DUF1616 domain-containing protein [Methanomicrobiales archaeon]